MGFQFAVKDYEKMAWEARLVKDAKLIAMAVKNQINWETKQARISIPKLAYMCNCDQRTVRKYLPDVQRVLGIEIIETPGHANLFQFQVFETAEEIQALLEQKEWRNSKWFLFKKTDLEEIIEQPGRVLSGDSSKDPPPSPHVPPTLHVPSRAMSGDPSHAVPGDSPHGMSDKNILSFSSHSGATAKGGKRPRAKKQPPPGVEMFLDDYLRAMMAQPAKGSAPARQRAMEPNATAVKKQWAKLTQAQADAARAHIPQHARNKSAFMLNPENYIEQRVWERQSQGAAPDLEAKGREIRVQVLMHYARTNEWLSEARDEWGSPPGINGSKVPQELWCEAQSRVRQMAAVAGHAHV